MKNYISDYIKHIEIESDKNIKQCDIDKLLVKISFFKHERLIHLIVTVFFALFTIAFFYITYTSNLLIYLLITIILFVMLLFYIFHYFFLENSVQHLYKIYDKMLDKIK